jgi:hypothetical protein
LVGSACSSKRGEDIKFPRLQVGGLERFPAILVHTLRDASHAGENLEWCDVEVWSFSRPGFDDAVNIISGRGHHTIICPLAD